MVYIVLLNWKAYRDTINCIRSLFELKEACYKLIVVDNGSTDDSEKKILEYCRGLKNSSGEIKKLVELNADGQVSSLSADGADVYFLQTGRNLGFAGGNNRGIEFAQSRSDMKYVWILNNDTEVESKSLYFLLRAFEANAELGVCGSRLVYFESRERMQGLGGIYNPILCTSKHYAQDENSWSEFDDKKVAKSINYVIGASMLIAKPVLERIGLFREDYFLYYEEIDFCTRLSKAGFDLGVASKSVVYHKEGAATKKKETSMISDFYFVRNRLIYTSYFHPRLMIFAWFSVLVAVFNRLRRGEYSKARWALRILIVAFGGRKKIIALRIQNNF